MKRTSFLAVLIALPLVGVFMSGTAQAVLYSYESFNYTAGDSLVGQNGGTGFAGAWTQVGNSGVAGITTNSLTYSDLEVAGNKTYLSPTSASSTLSGARRAFSSTESTGTVYLSFLVNLDAGNRYFGLRLYDGSAGTSVIQIAKQGNATNWSLTDNARTTDTGAAATLDTTFMFVLRVDFNASGVNERIRLYIDPTVGGTEPLTAAVDVITTASLQFSQLDMVGGYTAAGQSTSQGAFDELRLGPTWADVTVPEPSVVALLGIGMGSIVFFRRRPACI